MKVRILSRAEGATEHAAFLAWHSNYCIEFRYGATEPCRSYLGLTREGVSCRDLFTLTLRPQSGTPVDIEVEAPIEVPRNTRSRSVHKCHAKESPSILGLVASAFGPADGLGG